MLAQLVESFVPRKNPLLKDLPVNRQDIRDNFKSVVQIHSFKVFLQEQDLDVNEVKDNMPLREDVIERYRSHLLRELLSPSGQIFHHYLKTVENITCTPAEEGVYDTIIDSMNGLEMSLLNDHIARLYPQGQPHNSSNIVRNTTEKIKNTLTFRRKK